LSENAPFKGDHHHDASESWLAAIAYLPVLCFIPYFFYGSRSFVAYHARQGVLLFLLEVVGALTLLAVDMSIGRIPFLGFLVIFMLRLVYYLPILALIVLGFAKALTGEIGPLPWVGHWAERIPPARSGD
jgi:uncharacterized membrane protein